MNQFCGDNLGRALSTFPKLRSIGINQNNFYFRVNDSGWRESSVVNEARLEIQAQPRIPRTSFAFKLFVVKSKDEFHCYEVTLKESVSIIANSLHFLMPSESTGVLVGEIQQITLNQIERIEELKAPNWPFGEIEISKTTDWIQNSLLSYKSHYSDLPNIDEIFSSKRQQDNLHQQFRFLASLQDPSK